MTNKARRCLFLMGNCQEKFIQFETSFFVVVCLLSAKTITKTFVTFCTLKKQKRKKIGKWENYEVFACSREFKHKYFKYIKSKKKKKLFASRKRLFVVVFASSQNCNLVQRKSRERLRRGFFHPLPSTASCP